MTVIARKPKDATSDYIVVDRGVGVHPFVSATATPQSLAEGQWFWGHYFPTREEALQHFASRTP